MGSSTKLPERGAFNQVYRTGEVHPIPANEYFFLAFHG
jgi:hypothetical protein